MTRLLISCLLLAMTGGCQRVPPSSTVPAPDIDSITEFKFGDQDLRAHNATCSVEIGSSAKIVLVGPSRNFPADMGVCIAQVTSTIRGQEVLMQSCHLDVTRNDPLITITGLMQIPKPPCTGRLQIVHGKKVLIEREVSFVSKE